MQSRYARTLIIAIGILMAATLASAQSAASTDAANSEGWKTIIYPIHAWLPIFGADVRLPPETPPGGGVTIPEGSVSSNFNGAALAGFRVERARFSVEGEFLWAGMSGSVDLPRLDVDVNTVAYKFTGGFELLPALYVDAGVSRFAVDITASFLTFAPVNWKPGIWQPIVGTTYRPFLTKKLRLYTHADMGFGGEHRSAAAIGSIEWKPISHLTLGGGWGFKYIRADGKILTKDIHFTQTLNGPVFTLGIPF